MQGSLYRQINFDLDFYKEARAIAQIYRKVIKGAQRKTRLQECCSEVSLESETHIRNQSKGEIEYVYLNQCLGQKRKGAGDWKKLFSHMSIDGLEIKG